eukprot:symbB.v1.2.019640.t1/scaffold1617.1/size109270/4
MKRSQFIKLRERVESGEETNPLVRSFFELPNMMLEQLPLHRLANCHNFRQEVSETMAVLQTLDLLKDFAEIPKLHVVDLCCGSGLTSFTLTVATKTVERITAVDRRPEQVMPHFKEAGLTHVNYLSADMLSPGFFGVLETLLLEVSLPVVLLGMHCCGVWGPTCPSNPTVGSTRWEMPEIRQNRSRVP